VRVAARAAVFEGDAVFAAPAPGSGHGGSILCVPRIASTALTSRVARPTVDP
jgi:hypothetical protein